MLRCKTYLLSNLFALLFIYFYCTFIFLSSFIDSFIKPTVEQHKYLALLLLGSNYSEKPCEVINVIILPDRWINSQQVSNTKRAEDLFLSVVKKVVLRQRIPRSFLVIQDISLFARICTDCSSTKLQQLSTWFEISGRNRTVGLSQQAITKEP